MEIIEVSAREYNSVISEPYHIFGSTAFNELNEKKCDDVFYLLFREGKLRLGIIVGLQEGNFNSPFSAPYGGFIPVSENIRIHYLEDAIKLLLEWIREKGYSSINVTMPPLIYNQDFISKQINCFWREGFEITEIDLNHSLNLSLIDDNYLKRIWRNARKNLQIGLNSGLKLKACANKEDKKLAYEIIRKNREYRNFPLRMTWEELLDTTQIVPSDFYLVYNEKQVAIASAIIYHINKSIVQVIYWGHLSDYSELKPVNYLAFKLFEYYKTCDKKFVDIGPSTENSDPNHGLCAFKESIGCRTCNKFTFTKKNK